MRQDASVTTQMESFIDSWNSTGFIRRVHPHQTRYDSLFFSIENIMWAILFPHAVNAFLCGIPHENSNRQQHPEFGLCSEEVLDYILLNQIASIECDFGMNPADGQKTASERNRNALDSTESTNGWRTTSTQHKPRWSDFPPSFFPCQ